MRYKFLLVASAATLAGAAMAAGPLDSYYLTDGMEGVNAIITGSSIAPLINQAVGNEYGIAVSGDIRTTSDVASGLGGRYNLAFTPTGTTPAQSQIYYDGTTNGIRNFGMNFGNGNVYSSNTDWSSPAVLFAATTPNTDLGITYDASNNSLWISSWTGSSITDYAMNGTVLSSFNAILPSGASLTHLTCLGLDSGDGTLWFGSQTTEGTFYQYDKAGHYLQQQFYDSLAGHNTLGGEFNRPAGTPEPFTLALGTIGIAVALRRRFKSLSA